MNEALEVMRENSKMKKISLKNSELLSLKPRQPLPSLSSKNYHQNMFWSLSKINGAFLFPTSLISRPHRTFSIKKRVIMVFSSKWLCIMPFWDNKKRVNWLYFLFMIISHYLEQLLAPHFYTFHWSENGQNGFR